MTKSETDDSFCSVEEHQGQESDSECDSDGSCSGRNSAHCSDDEDSDESDSDSSETESESDLFPMEAKRQALTVIHTAVMRILTAQIVTKVIQTTGSLILIVTRAHAAAVAVHVKNAATMRVTLMCAMIVRVIVHQVRTQQTWIMMETMKMMMTV